MQEKSTLDIVDDALVEFAERRFTSLRSNLPRPAFTDRVLGALEDLKKLQGDGSPDYSNPWVGLFYTTWYQPRQINLAYWTVRKLFQELKPPARAIEVVDFGSGSGAFSIGLACALAEFGQESLIRDVRMHCIDQKEMYRTGGVLWLPFLRRLKHQQDAATTPRYSFRPAESAFSIDDKVVISRDSNRDCWLIASHVLYKERIEHLKWDLLHLRQTLRPEVICLTGPSFKSALADVADPAREAEHDKSAYSPRLPRSGILPKITNWRKNLNTNVLTQSHNYLDGSVQWTSGRKDSSPFVRLALRKDG